MTIFDVWIIDVTAYSYTGSSIYQELQTMANIKKRKQLQAFMEALRNFTPLIFSAEGCMGRERHTTGNMLAAIRTKNWDWEYVDTYRYVRARLSLSLTISLLHILRGEKEKIA